MPQKTLHLKYSQVVTQVPIEFSYIFLLLSDKITGAAPFLFISVSEHDVTHMVDQYDVLWDHKVIKVLNYG